MHRLLSKSMGIGQDAPLLIYGTAWKDGKTAELTTAALNRGFKGVDTGNHPTGYNERGAGEGIAAALASGVKREDLIVQSKFSPTFTHDPAKIPYDTSQDVAGQARESVEQTLNNLRKGYPSCVGVLESYVPHKIRFLGVSNTTLDQLQGLYEKATIKPVVVQNRFYRESQYDLTIRAFCKDHDIVYQAFWMLKNNPDLLGSDVVKSVATKLGVEREAAFYSLILSLGDTQVLNGTTTVERMESDLKAVSSLLEGEGAEKRMEELQPFVVAFKRLLWKLACEYKGPLPTLSSERP